MVRAFVDEQKCTLTTQIPVREHFSSPLLQFAEKDEDSTFTLIECPSKKDGHFFVHTLTWPVGGTGQLISCLTNNEIDIAMCVSKLDKFNRPD